MPVAVITGVSKGIGLAIARRFAREGFMIIGCASSERSVLQAQTAEPSFDIHQVDVRNRADLKRFAEAITQHTDKVDVLVNNAGRYLPGRIQDEAEGTFDEMIAVNLSSVYHFTRLILQRMLPYEQGHILNICSTASIKAYPNGGSYCIAKHGLLGLTRVLREELKPQSIRVTALMPGATLTDSWAGTDLPESRFVRSEDIAELAWTAHSLSPGAVLEELVVRPQLGDLG